MNTEEREQQPTTTAAVDINRRWSTVYPKLGTEPVPTKPYISPEYFELERERIFFLHVS